MITHRSPRHWSCCPAFRSRSRQHHRSSDFAKRARCSSAFPGAYLLHVCLWGGRQYGLHGVEGAVLLPFFPVSGNCPLQRTPNRGSLLLAEVTEVARELVLDGGERAGLGVRVATGIRWTGRQTWYGARRRMMLTGEMREMREMREMFHAALYFADAFVVSCV